MKTSVVLREVPEKLRDHLLVNSPQFESDYNRLKANEQDVDRKRLYRIRSVTDLTALTLCRGTVPVCRRVARSANSDSSPFNVYIPVRINVNNGSECAPLNFVMASAAFRLCGHHRGRHIALRINSSMIGTSRADFRSSCGKSLSNASNKPLESMTSVLSGS